MFCIIPYTCINVGCCTCSIGTELQETKRVLAVELIVAKLHYKMGRAIRSAENKSWLRNFIWKRLRIFFHQGGMAGPQFEYISGLSSLWRCLKLYVYAPGLKEITFQCDFWIESIVWYLPVLGLHCGGVKPASVCSFQTDVLRCRILQWRLYWNLTSYLNGTQSSSNR